MIREVEIEGFKSIRQLRLECRRINLFIGRSVVRAHFLLHRPMARRPGRARSATRGISTGVTSRGTPGRAFEGGQPVIAKVDGSIEVPIHLQPAGRTTENPPGQLDPGSHPSALGTLSGGREAPRRHDEAGAIPGALILQHPPEGPPSHILDGPGKVFVPHQTPNSSQNSPGDEEAGEEDEALEGGKPPFVPNRPPSEPSFQPSQEPLEGRASSPLGSASPHRFLAMPA